MKALLANTRIGPIAEAVVLIALGAVLSVVAIRYDLFDWFYGYSREHEAMELDEIVLALMTFGTLGFFYALRWLVAFRLEVIRRRRAESDVAWLGHHDPLTRLPNRRFLTEFIKKTSAGNTSQNYAVYWLDLKGFKKINELFGHGGGDEFLVEIATRLKQIAYDELVVRQGADEFIIIASRKHIGDPRKLANRIVNAVEKPARIRNADAQVGAMLGVALCPDDATTLKETIRRAGLALNVAKHTVNDRVRVFNRDMEAILAEQAELEIGLARAINRNEIVPHYQPVFDLSTGKLHTFEALARWTRKGEKVPPHVFIEMAEKTGMIVALSERVLRQACLDARGWPSHIRLAVNISADQLTDRQLGHRIARILKETGFPARRLEIEVTESALVVDVETALAVLDELRNAGVTIALDDFGTGYSSLSQLSRFTFDVLKIDRSFVASFQQNAKQNKIVRAIIALSKGLSIATTAEGIETERQLKQLEALGCSYGQGYLLGKPMPADQLGNLFEQDASNFMEAPAEPVRQKRAANG